MPLGFDAVSSWPLKNGSPCKQSPSPACATHYLVAVTSHHVRLCRLDVLNTPPAPAPLLLLCVAASSTQSSNFVMTAAAQNLLCLQLAASIGVSLDDPFKTWLLGGCVPACLGECELACPA
jgi:hypothetical protein